ncbi:unnamed protein product [Symbiodinium sp. CCMP2456]|nr:unnamed protein product [Symbiodinium sp. CCMP2456]
MFGGPWDIYVAMQEDPGQLSPVTTEYDSSSPPSSPGGFIKWNVPGHGWALAHQKSVEDEQPYYLYDTGDGSVQLLQSKLSQLTDSHFFWDISQASGGMIKNIGTQNCLKMGTVTLGNAADEGDVGGNDCGPSGLLNSILTSDYGAPNRHQCAVVGQTLDWTNQGASCQEPVYAHTTDATTVTVMCPDGLALQSTSMEFLSEHKETDYNFTCCTPMMPPYVTWDNDEYDLDYTYCNLFLAGVNWNGGAAYRSNVKCMGRTLTTVDASTLPLTTGTCDANDVFQQWEFINNASKDPSAATGGRQPRKVTQDDFVSLTDYENFVNVSNCEASLTLQDSASAIDGIDLALEIWDFANLDAQQRQAYQYVDHYEVVKTHGNGTKVLFACQAAEFDQSSSQGSTCSQWASVSPEDLSKIYTAATTLMIEKICPVLMNSSMSVSPSVAKPTNVNGMTLKVLAAILRNAPYKTLPFGDARGWPFFYKGSSGERAQSMGYLSVAASGDAFWGVTCPPGAVVVSEEKTLPHCLDIHASDSQEVLSAYSGSATCPSGYAISGWYNLPGIKVRGNQLTGGPQNWTELKVFCRRTNLIGFCDHPSKPHCTAGHVVNAVSYSQNQFKLGCCRFLWPMGASLLAYGRVARPYLSFEGYYCPTQMGSTGSPLYGKTPMGALGEPGTSSDFDFTLSWDKFSGDWNLRKGTDTLYAVHSNALSPTETLCSQHRASHLQVVRGPGGSSICLNPKLNPLNPKAYTLNPKP